MQIPSSTLEEQFAASNPENSSWVSANAGSGKTHVLTQRVIRLMLDNNSPDRILCLTFTKAAAANMKNRVFGTLAKWTMMADEELEAAIQSVTGSPPGRGEKRRARQLFASALDTPGGLKIQTIHAFCEGLLHQFPLEANVPGHFEALQETQQTTLLANARAFVLGKRAMQYQDDPQTQANLHYAALVPYATDTAIDEALDTLISKRHEFLDWVGSDVDAAMEELARSFNVDMEVSEEELMQGVFATLPQNGILQQIKEAALNSEKATDQKLGAALIQYLESSDVTDRYQALSDVCLTKERTIKSERSVATKAVKEAVPLAVDTIHAIGQQLIECDENIRLLNLVKTSRHLFHLGAAVLQRYEQIKRSIGVIDFDDQIRKSAVLLNRADIRDWIRFRLDRGIDHVLVDEAQDTSPTQWEIINAITDDFYSGENASKKNRTIFVVGDEKQSIYSFQGAEPEEFDRQQRILQRRTEHASLNQNFKNARLNLSFRSTLDVLHAVDRVFENEIYAEGLTQSGESPTHDAIRRNDPGEVQIWPLYRKADVDVTESWLDPIDREGDSDPALQLAQQITEEIGNMVGSKLPGMSAPLEFGDILVLVRRRDRFIPALTRTMKQAGLAVAGADRLTLTEHIAVEDLLVAGRVALLPQDDLSLACLLKSIFFDLDEKKLFELCYGRGDISLFDQLQTISRDTDHAHNSSVVAILAGLEEMFLAARSLNEFEFYATLLGKMGGRKKIVSRLGVEAEDVIDSFLDEALVHSREKHDGLEGFISELTRSKPEIKREVDLDRDEVRIMTVHASKGLEARVVFLVDPCNPAWNENHRPKIMDLPDYAQGDAASMLWVPSSKQHITYTRELTESYRKAANEEYKRLLYVGMTRAADKLVVCGFAGKKEISHEHWHNMVLSSLEDTATEICDEEGNTLMWRWTKDQNPSEPTKAEALGTYALAESAPLPSWLFTPAAEERPLQRPLSPSGAIGIIENENNVPRQYAAPVEQNPAEPFLERGNAIHRLLEVLPDIADEQREAAGLQYLKKKLKDWNQQKQEEILASCLRILRNPDYSHLFEGKSRAEVSLTGNIQCQSGPLQIAGQIDRLIISDDHVTILDYKTNQIVPKNYDEVPETYLVQLGLYSELVSQLYPSKEVIAAILWTQKPAFTPIPNEILSKSIEIIKKR